METFLCSDVIFLAGSWHEVQKGNTQQGTWLYRLVLFLKREQRSGCSGNNAEPKAAHPALPGQRRQTEPGSGHRARHGQEELCHICRQGQSEKRSLEELQNKEQHPGLGIPTCCSCSPQDVWSVLTELTTALQWFQGRQCTARPTLKTQCRPTHLYPYYCIGFSGTEFGDLLAKIQWFYFFSTQGLVFLDIELVKNQLHGVKDRGTQWCLLILLIIRIQSSLYFLIFHILYFLLAGLKNHFSPIILVLSCCKILIFPPHTSSTLHGYSFCYSFLLFWPDWI